MRIVFSVSASPFSVKHSPYPQARTLDHIVAEKIGTQTPFKTLEFSCNSHKDNKESIQFDNISWYGTEYVAPSMRDPLLAYRRLFKSDERSAYRNITDWFLRMPVRLSASWVGRTKTSLPSTSTRYVPSSVNSRDWRD